MSNKPRKRKNPANHPIKRKAGGWRGDETKLQGDVVLNWWGRIQVGLGAEIVTTQIINTRNARKQGGELLYSDAVVYWSPWRRFAALVVLLIILGGQIHAL